MSITLVKACKTEFLPRTFDVKIEQSQTLSLPTIFEDYSHYIWYKKNNNNNDFGTSSTNSTNY
jgi:hypothetical protein